MIGKTLGHYQITSQLGKGGMGEVFQAKDQVLGREVAIKVLPEEFAKDADRVARFQREAKLLASLNHPNIAAIHGLEESNGTNFLVLELVEGETLGDRIKAGPIPVEEALKSALQIAEALEAAHEKGIIHRDLKPANIKITPDGKAKVLDFGLAKAYAGEQAESNLSASPTLSNLATQHGIILGTAAYMSPEQARGESVDKKSDIWAFGCVLFEMLTGRATFEGRTVSDVLASVIKSEPEWKRLPPNLHPRIRLLLERCLEKEPQNRYGVISDARVDIQKALAGPSGMLDQPSALILRQSKPRLILPWIAAVLGIVIGGMAVWKLKPPEPRPLTRFVYELPGDQRLGAANIPLLAVSTDGRQFVYSTSKGLYLRSMGEYQARPIAGTETYPSSPFFSPDGKWVGYYSSSDAKLKKVATGGGTPVVLCDASLVLGASWGADGTIVYGELGRGIMRVSANGGIPEELIKLTGIYMNTPQVLPDGSAVLFGHVTPEKSQVIAQSLKTGERRALIDGKNPHYLPTGHIIYVVENAFLAVPFDAAKLEIAGAPVPLTEDVFRGSGANAPQYAASDAGTFVYLPPIATYAAGRRTLVWVDREGKESPLAALPDAYHDLRISPDGTRVALAIASADIWILDLVRNTKTRLTFDPVTDRFPFWTSDGKRIAFHSDRNFGIYQRASDGTGKDEPLCSMHGREVFPWSWSGDGKSLVVEVAASATGENSDIGVLSMEGDHTIRLILREKYSEFQPRISPDGKRIAYTSNESGKNEVYIRLFPKVEEGRWQVSTSGGDSPLWSPDGRELFYLNGDAVMAVPVKTERGFGLETPQVLFRGTFVPASSVVGDRNPWDISPDGKRFLMMKESTSDTSKGPVPRPQINIVLNWTEELKQRVPTK